jgi:hypothetical protein
MHIQAHRLIGEGFIKYAVDVGSVATIHIPSFIKIGSDFQKSIGWGGGDSQTHIYTNSMEIA